MSDTHTEQESPAAEHDKVAPNEEEEKVEEEKDEVKDEEAPVLEDVEDDAKNVNDNHPCRICRNRVVPEPNEDSEKEFRGISRTGDGD